MANKVETRDSKKKESQKVAEEDAGDVEVKTILRSVAAQLGRLEKLMEAKASKQSVDELTLRVDALEAKSEDHSELTKRVETLEATGGTDIAEESESMERKIKEQVQKGIEEYRERETRKLNLILHNVPESESETAEERKDEDLTKVDEIMRDIGCPDIKSDSAVRLGKATGDRIRLLKVRVPTTGEKHIALNKARLLRQSQVEAHRRIYISPDLTPEARLQGKRLREQLKARRDQGETGLVIRRGQIVQEVATEQPELENTTRERGAIKMTIRRGRIITNSQRSQDVQEIQPFPANTTDTDPGGDTEPNEGT